jgi:hypothetical protein
VGNDQDPLVKLLLHEHLDLSERKLIPTPIPMQEITARIASILEHEGWFPPSSRAWEKEGDPCWEGGILERRGPAFVLHLQSHHPLNPGLRTRYRVQKFRAVQPAIARLVRVRWGSHIDGIPIES